MRLKTLIFLIAAALLLVACKPPTVIDREMQAQGLLTGRDEYLYGVPVREYGTLYGTPSSVVSATKEVFEAWAGAMGGPEGFQDHVVGDSGVSTIVLDYTGIITSDKAVFFFEGNDRFPQGTLAVNMLVHLNEQTDVLMRAEYKMSLAHELAHAYDSESGMAASTEFERSGAAALSAYSGENTVENFAESTAAFLTGLRPVGEPYVTDWLNAYLVQPNLPGDQAIPYNPDEWPR